MNGIRHTKTSPYNPSTNGLAERYVREFKNLLRKNNGKDDLETNLQSFLFAHRAFPQTVIKEFPGGTANEENFNIKILEFNTKMGNPREVFHEAVCQAIGEAIFLSVPIALGFSMLTACAKPEHRIFEDCVNSQRVKPLCGR
ncbi:K02A2.6-like [Cordylochernes scorpioides]|uniref:K02A2.6-like n=1 Tax=Cordylochernes scorpioides TaxID=51811 RepID=A0ABY6K334_9ARAC|nr:K02A2.6-like [Cordylochernes scorpioides]